MELQHRTFSVKLYEKSRVNSILAVARHAPASPMTVSPDCPGNCRGSPWGLHGGSAIAVAVPCQPHDDSPQSP